MTSQGRPSMAIVNSAGYLLQYAVEHEIRRTYEGHSWRVAAREQRWQLPETEEEGFADLVLEGGGPLIERVVLECKKVKDGSWLFLAPEPARPYETRARLLWLQKGNVKPSLWWRECTVNPPSYESAFCIPKDEKSRNAPTLESSGGLLLRSTEALALEDLEQARPRNLVYIPMIVTTARLWVCRLALSDIDLASGELPSNWSQFEEVRYVRFRKGLSTCMPAEACTGTLDISERNREQERTVLVVRADAISEVLRYWTTSVD